SSSYLLAPADRTDARSSASPEDGGTKYSMPERRAAMFKSIIWATDGSAAADRAMPYVKSLASHSGAEVVVLHCDELLMGRGGGQHMIPDEDNVRQKIEAQAEELSDAGIRAESRIVTVTTAGSAHTIAETA